MRRLLLLVTLPFLLDALVAYALAAEPDGGFGYAVFFDWDQAVLSTHARATLQAAGRAAEIGSAIRIRIAEAEGFARVGAYGAALRQTRRRNLVAELRRDGVAPDRIAAASAHEIRVAPIVVMAASRGR